jgi:hypothetical protein
MPNWCNNRVVISHPDTAKLEALVGAIKEGNFLKHIVPIPEDLNIVAGRVGDDSNPDQIELERREKENLEKYGAANWYDFCVARWGTKWDVDAYDKVEFDDQWDKNNKITFGFDSAWSPPIGIYEELVEQGFSVRAYYYESGMCFAGLWDDGYDDFYELGGMNSEQVREELPNELDEMFAISENMAEWEAENAE